MTNVRPGRLRPPDSRFDGWVFLAIAAGRVTMRASIQIDPGHLSEDRVMSHLEHRDGFALGRMVTAGPVVSVRPHPVPLCNVTNHRQGSHLAAPFCAAGLPNDK
jgi:hypothetical protein